MLKPPVQTENPAPILAIDTSSAQGAVALFDGHNLSYRSWPAARAHTSTLLCEVHHLLDAAKRDVGDVVAIVLAVGPGTFTGLRVGFGLAKGFHLATDAPLIGVPTLLATAFPFADCGRLVLATVEAGRGRLVWSTFRREAGCLRELDTPRNSSVAEFIARAADAGPCLIAGEIDPETERELSLIHDAVVPPRAVRMRQPGALAALGWARWQQGQIDDPVSLEPMYLSR